MTIRSTNKTPVVESSYGEIPDGVWMISGHMGPDGSRQVTLQRQEPDGTWMSAGGSVAARIPSAPPEQAQEPPAGAPASP